MNNNKIIFSINQQQKDALYLLEEGKSTIVLRTSKRLCGKFEAIAKSNNLDPFKVMRKLVAIYLHVRKSSQENPHKGLRALLRVWVSRATNGNLRGFEKCERLA